MMRLRYICLFVLSFFPLVAHSQGAALSLTDSEVSTLALDAQWLNLLHYKSKGSSNTWKGDFRSYVDDREFFLSRQGHADPKAELIATLNAFVSHPESQCRFPARRMWLQKQSSEIVSKLTIVECKQYNTWRDNVNAHQAVLVFASSYINSPSSMYGHTFLRFDPPEIEQGSTLLSYALSFGANIPADDNGLLFAYRGLFGGYPGTFDAKPYYEKVKEYSRMDNRDLWEYRLNLSAKELELLMAHVWELNKINFDYFFFDENCSLRLMELLDIARPGIELAVKFTDVAIPIDTVRVVGDAEIIVDVNYRPSNQAKLKIALANLSDEERALVVLLSHDKRILESDLFKGLSKERQKQVAHAAYSYLRYRTNKHERSKAVASRNIALLRIMNDKEKPFVTPAVERPVAPEDGHKTKMLALALGEEDGQAYADIDFHMSYHDLLDNNDGYPANSSLNMGRVVFRAKEGGAVQLQRFDLIEIASLSPRDDFFKPVSWRFSTGLERQWVKGKDELAVQLNGGGGLTYPLVGSAYAYGLATLRLEYNEGLDKNLDVAPGVALGIIWGRSAHQGLLSLEHYRFIDKVDRDSASLAYNWSLGANDALRFKVKRQLNDSMGVTEGSVSYRHYF